MFNKPHTLEAKQKISQAKSNLPPWNKNKSMSDKYKEKCRQRQLGKSWSPLTQFTSERVKKMWSDKDRLEQMKGKISILNRGKKLSYKHRAKISNALAGKYCGKDNWNYKNGMRALIKEWRSKVYKRDNYICQMPECNHEIRYLNAHHIKRQAEYPKLRLVLDNGITLCKDCHYKTVNLEHKYEKLFMEIIKVRNRDIAIKELLNVKVRRADG